MNLLDVLRAREERATVAPLSFQEWVDLVTWQGLQYPLGVIQTQPGERTEEIGQEFSALLARAYERSGIVFAVELARMLHFSEARFTFRGRRSGRPGPVFGTEALAPLEEPWVGGTTGDLLSRMLLHADFAGNAFVVKRPNGRLKLLRPDWMTIVCGSKRDARVKSWDPDAELLGYLYHPGGYHSQEEPVAFPAELVAHFAPIPDPDAEYRGTSWLLPVIRDVMGDQAATTHKLRFFEGGATPNLVVGLSVNDPDKFKAWIELFREQYEGAANAYKTMFLGAGADPKVVGADFRQMDFKATVGVSETRVAACGGVPPVIVGLSEGLQGAALNAGNYKQAYRRFADGTMRPLWRNAAGSLARVVDVPPGAELWYDVRDIAFLRDDEQIEAEILRTKSVAMRQLIDAGFRPDTAVDAITSGDMNRLVHTGLFSVQLQPPGSTTPPTGNGQASLDLDDLVGRVARELRRVR